MSEIGQRVGWLNIRRQAVPEDKCSNWKRTSADGSYRRYAGTCNRCDEDERRRLWFARDIWRYRNVFWLIDWLIDDDDQADQQRELADPGMAETDHLVLKTPWLQLCSRPVVVHATSSGLQGRQWCSRSVEVGTPDKLQRWAQTGVVAEDRLLAQPMWHSDEDGEVDQERQNSIRRFSEREAASRHWAPWVVSGATVWNDLPLHVASRRRHSRFSDNVPTKILSHNLF